MSSDPFALLSGAGARRTAAPEAARAKPDWIAVVPVPADAPAPPSEHFKLGKSTAIWTYTNASGAVLGYALRFDGAEGKQFQPLTFCRPAAGGRTRLRRPQAP